jgi:hypothetical protein
MIEWVGDVTLSPSGKQVVLEEECGRTNRKRQDRRERFYYDPSVMQQ